MGIVSQPPRTERISALLGEYADKLRNLLETHQTLQSSNQPSIVILSTFVIAASIFGAAYIPNHSMLDPVSLGVLAAWAATTVSTVALISRNKKRRKELRFEVLATSTKLVKAVQYASQVNDHVELETQDTIELELRLADAESALHRAEGLLGRSFDIS